MSMQHLIDFNDMPMSDWETILEMALEISKNPADYADACKGKILATLFFESSTRTYFSFQTAMLRLGGSVIGFTNAANSSLVKGETLTDTIKIISSYSDIIAIRHSLEGSARAASMYSRCPIINAGDGGHLHPTQTMTDLFTIKKTKGTLEGLDIGICGDLKYGRTVHSLIKAMTLFPGNRFHLVSAKGLELPDYVSRAARFAGMELITHNKIEDCIGELDVLYMTRIQKERFTPTDRQKFDPYGYVLDAKKMTLARPDMIVMHPMPKVNEIAKEVDEDPRAMYFEQALNGMYIRMALIKHLLSQVYAMPVGIPAANDNMRCFNAKCVTNTERYLPTMVKEIDEGGVKKTLCSYCDYEWR
jgi:aspartate carbamoyltransferase catalytic subunit